MNNAHQWVRDHLWIVTTGLTSAVVFVVAFFAVSAITDDDVVATVARVPVPAAPTTPIEDPIIAEPPVETTPADPSPSTTEPEPVDVEPAPDPVVSTLPEFDEETLVFGGTGSEGATLAGTGIVASSLPENQTNWEMLIPSAQIRASIVRVGPVGNNGFGAPDNPQVIGWWDRGPAPGEAGNVLLDGHRDFSDIEDNVGTGVCWLLPNATIDDFIIIRDYDAEVSYVYSIIETNSVPFDSAEGVEYLQPAPAGQFLLTLITCEGSFDGEAHNYSNRRIVVAEMTDTVPFTS